ncbi:MAG: ABC transporter permease [Acidobacteriia bacterium]|nr:ABC transporter permease [Terriglobia bacterium]
MNLQSVSTVFRKELLDTLRDRRTLISSILLPILLFPLLFLGFGTLGFMIMTRIGQEKLVAGIRGAEHAPTLAAQLRAHPELETVAADEDFRAAILAKRLRAVVEFPSGFEEHLRARPDASQSVLLYYNSSDQRSDEAADDIEETLARFGAELVQQRLATQGLPEGIGEPFRIAKQNVATAERVGGNILGLLLPYFIIALCLTGAMYPAMDVTAGEKERGTIETVLASPVRRTDLVLGKFLLVSLVAAVTTALAIASFSLTATLGAGLLARVSDRLVLALSAKAAAAVFFMVLPLAVTFAAGLMAVALLARNYREAQTYLGPLLFVVILPAVASMLPGIELTPKLALVPVLNVALVAKEIFVGNYPWKLIGIIFGSTCVYAALALWAAVRQFHREEVLFRS